jgi:hypothetical protein
MGQAGGTIGIVLGIALLLAAAVIHSEVENMKEKEETYCGGLLEYLLDWDGNCDELRRAIADAEMGRAATGFCGGIFLLMGLVELSSANSNKQQVGYVMAPAQPQMVTHYVQAAPTPTVQPIATSDVVQQPVFNAHQWALENIGRFGMQCFPLQTHVHWSVAEVNMNAGDLVITAMPNPTFGYEWVKFSFDVFNDGPALRSCHVFSNDDWQLMVEG